MLDDLLDLFDRKSRRTNSRPSGNDAPRDHRAAEVRPERDDDDYDDDREERRPRTRKRRFGELLDFD